MAEVACPYCKSIGEHACNCWSPIPRTWKDIKHQDNLVEAAMSEVKRLHMRIAYLERCLADAYEVNARGGTGGTAGGPNTTKGGENG